MTWQGFTAGLQQLVGILGRPAVVIMCVVVVVIVGGSLAFLGYMSLKFGDRALEMLLPFVREVISTLRNESTRTHPAVRLELRFHHVLAAVIFFCLVATAVHALVPWAGERAQTVIICAFITSFVLSSILGAISLRLSLRLK